MKREDLQKEIERIEDLIKKNQQKVHQLRAQLSELIKQEREREHYMSSKEVLDLIYEHTGKQSNMSTIKRWADGGYLGSVVLEKDKFWAIRSKQGKKRFLYPKQDVFSFLHTKGFLQPKFDILDRIQIIDQHKDETGVIVDSYLKEDQFCYTVQLEKSRQVLKDIRENEVRHTG